MNISIGKLLWQQVEIKVHRNAPKLYTDIMILTIPFVLHEEDEWADLPVRHFPTITARLTKAINDYLIKECNLHSGAINNIQTELTVKTSDKIVSRRERHRPWTSPPSQRVHLAAYTMTGSNTLLARLRHSIKVRLDQGRTNQKHTYTYMPA